MEQVLEWGSLVVAGVAVAVAFASWHASSRAATAAEESAEASLRSADAAEQAVEIEQDRRHSEREPTFTVNPTLEEDPFEEGESRLQVVLTSHGHTDLDDVVVKVKSSSVGGGGSPFIIEGRAQTESASLGIVRVGSSKAFYLKGGIPGESVTLLLESTAGDGWWRTLDNFRWPGASNTDQVSIL